jgi:hypothetical protein
MNAVRLINPGLNRNHSPRPRPRTRRRPPYSEIAQARIQAHPGPLTAIDFRIFTGAGGWNHAKNWNRPPAPGVATSVGKPVILLPPYEEPEWYDWSLVRGLEPWVIETGATPESVLQRFALLLLAAGASAVRVSQWERLANSMIVFRLED